MTHVNDIRDLRIIVDDSGDPAIVVDGDVVSTTLEGFRLEPGVYDVGHGIDFSAFRRRRT